jgi:outer membrane protein assembly factor BamA
MRGGIARLRNYGLILGSSYPFSKFRRIDLDFYVLGLLREFVQPEQSFSIVAPSISYVSDTIVWGGLGPVNGQGFRLSAFYSPEVGDNGLDFQLYTMDLRRYYMLSPGYSLAFRLSGGASGGRNAVKFFLGGIDSWINPGFEELGELSVTDIYFATILSPLRGTSYYEQKGTRAFLTNFEFRFPFVRYFSLNWPLPLTFSNVGGVIFADVGGAWTDDEKFKPFSQNRNGDLFMKDLLFGTGLGMRINIGFTILRIDVAWTSDLAGWSHPRYSFSLGPNF